MDYSNPLTLVLLIIGFIFSLSVHEYAHALVAYKFGDLTAKSEGRLTLNPLKHLDPLGLLALLIIRIGWAKPVPIDPRNFKYPERDMALVALAGPLSNFVLALVFLLFTPVLQFIVHINASVGTSALNAFYSIAFINILLAVFNLTPIPPLDGYRIVKLLIPRIYHYTLRSFEAYGPIIILVLLYFTRLGNWMVSISTQILNFFISFLR